MRAQHNLGLALIDADAFDEAAQVLENLLALNPGDNQGIRYLLLKLHAQSGRYRECEALMKLYPDDGMVEFPATALLIDLAKAKLTKRAAKLLAPLNRSNPFVLDMLKDAAAGKWPTAPKSAYVAFGSREQAASYLDAFKTAWLLHPRIFANFRELVSGAVA
jgi:predicted Zn-dependent protease